VRKIVQSKMTPIFTKYEVEMPLECPFHPKRDLFYPQEEAKLKYRPTQFTCGLCGKSFYEEKYLDLHFDNRHRTNVNHAEDAICLADYCDILRCDVLVMKDSSSSLESGTNIPVSTDIELYNEATALAAARREVVKSHMSTNSFNIPPSLKEKLNDLLAATGHKIEIPTPKEKIHKRRRNICNEQSNKSSNDSNDEKEGSSNSSCESPGDMRYNRFSEIQRLKAGCKHEDIHKLKNRCERLIRTCISNALTKLSIEDFKNLESEFQINIKTLNL
jgi:DNA-binding NarL/FixJ family response regulator